MTYLKREDLTPSDGIIVELLAVPTDTVGDLVHVTCTIKALDESLTPCIHVTAELIDAQLVPITDARGKPVRVEYKHNASQAEQDSHGLSAIVRECLMLVLGEPLTMVDANPGSEPPDLVTLIPWPRETVDGADLRRAMRIARESAAVVLGDVL